MTASPFAADFTADDARALAGLLKVVADPTRLRILHQLAAAPAAGVDLHAALSGITYPTMAHHLKILNTAGLITSSRDGAFVDRELNRAALEDLSRLISPAVRP